MSGKLIIRYISTLYILEPLNTTRHKIPICSLLKGLLSTLDSAPSISEFFCSLVSDETVLKFQSVKGAAKYINQKERKNKTWG